MEEPDGVRPAGRPPYQPLEPNQMTSAPTTDLQVIVDVPAAPAAAAPAREPAPVARERAGFAVAGTSLGLLALAVLAFLAQAGPLGWVQHARSQQVAYDSLRNDLSAATVPTGQLDSDGRLVAVGTPLGFLSFPALGLQREVFFEGTSSTVTEQGPGHRRSSVLPGQPGVAVLYGRAWGYGGPFRHLPQMVKGARLTVTTGQGVSTYRVVGTRHAGDAFQGPPVGKGLLTLVTAEGPAFAPGKAVYVDAELTSPPFPAPAQVLGAANLAAAEGPLAGDPAVWPVLFLVMQGLALASLLLAWASRRFGGLQAWLIGVPVTGLLLVLASREALRLLPNLL